MKPILGGLVIALLITSGAAAGGEPLTTAGATQAAPPASAATEGAPPLSAAPARRADADAAPPPADGQPGCRDGEAVDHRPHGEVWGGVGTHGYRNVGAAAAAPVGKCSSVSIAVDRVEGGFGGWRR